MSSRPIQLTGTFDWNGSNVRWARFGSGDPVVLCHGTPFSSFVWRRVANQLSDVRSVYVWDMLGYGQSDKPDGDVSLATQGEILAALVDHWDLSTPDVVAHDIGGAVVLRAHLLHGMTVSSLLLADIVALRPWGTPFFKLVGDNADVFNALPSNLHEALVREYISGASNHGLSEEVMDQLVAPWLGEQGQAGFYRQIAQGDEGYTSEIESRFGEVIVPTLIVWGKEDAWLDPAQAEVLSDTFPNSRLHLIEGAGHLVQEDEPDELATVISDWLSDW